MLFWSGLALYVASAFALMGAVLYPDHYFRYARWAVRRHGVAAVAGFALLMSLVLALGRQVYPNGWPGEMPDSELLFVLVMGPAAAALLLDVLRFRRASSAAQRRSGK